jgi:hypothetical protein
MTAPRGIVLVGHPFWRRPPSNRYLRAEKLRRRDFATRAADEETARALGLEVVTRHTASLAEFYTYESSQWRAAGRFAADHPGDPMSRKLTARRDRARRAYFEEGRKCLGWTLWAFQKMG